VTLLNRPFTHVPSVQGLGTSSHHEAKEYFKDLAHHQKPFRPIQRSEHELIDLAFSKKRADERKEWIRNYEVPIFFTQYRTKLTRLFDIIAWHLYRLQRA